MKKVVFLIIILIMLSCDGGLEPANPTILKGKILFSDIDTWPPSDSLIDLRLVALKNYPPADIVTEITSGNAYFTETLPFFVDSIDFELEIKDAPVELKYIGVAQNFDDILDWRVVGVYSENFDNNHSPLFINRGEELFINIRVDFNDIPEQPFEL